LKKLSRGEVVEVAPDSSDRGYIDQAIEIMCGEPEREEVKEAETTKYYKLTVKDREQIITRRTVKRPSNEKSAKSDISSN